MTDTVHVTKSAGQAGANVSAVSISDLAELLGNNAPTADPLTEGELWNDSGTIKVSLTPVAVTDFKNNVYSILGVPKTYADCYTENFNPGDSGTIGVITDVGLKVEFVGGGTATAASGSVEATASLRTVADPAVGFTAVFDVTPVTPTYAADALYGELIAANDAYDIYEQGGVSHSEIRLAIIPPLAFHSIMSMLEGEVNKVAFTVSNNFTAISVNGNPVTSFTPGLDLSTTDVYFYLRTDSGIVGSSVTIGGAKFYPMVTDSAALRRLSTQ